MSTLIWLHSYMCTLIDVYMYSRCLHLLWLVSICVHLVFVNTQHVCRHVMNRQHVCRHRQHVCRHVYRLCRQLCVNHRVLTHAACTSVCCRVTHMLPVLPCAVVCTGSMCVDMSTDYVDSYVSQVYVSMCVHILTTKYVCTCVHYARMCMQTCRV